jgi:hypothetical protein
MPKRLVPKRHVQDLKTFVPREVHAQKLKRIHTKIRSNNLKNLIDAQKMDWAKVKMPFPPSYVADERDESLRSIMCPEFRESRLMLNKLSHFDSSHPSSDLVVNWTISPEMTTVSALQSNRQLIYVDSAVKFDENGETSE